MHTDRAIDTSVLAVLSVVAAVCAASAAALALVTTVGIASSWADGPEGCEVWNEELETCLKWTIPSTEPGNPGSHDPGGSVAECRDAGGTVVPCTKDGLRWWGSPYYCYAELVDPQLDPPAGYSAEDGKWWTCSTGPDTARVWWVENGEEAVDPRAVAEQLVLRLPFKLANAQVAPPPSYHTYISYTNWLWIDEAQWAPVSATESLLGATITLTATPSYTSWDMGNGDTVSCVGPGRAWVKGMAEDAPTNCSYAYDEMKDPKGDSWTVSARINYKLAWTCSGNCGGLTSGDLGEQLAAAGDETTIAVYQRQTVAN